VATKINLIIFLSLVVVSCTSPNESTCRYTSPIYTIADGDLSIIIGETPDFNGDYAMTIKGVNFKQGVNLSTVSAKTENGYLLLKAEGLPKSIVIREQECQNGILDLVIKANAVKLK
jgi:hypothetical protein